jgi:hypothetical protein
MVRFYVISAESQSTKKPPLPRATAAQEERPPFAGPGREPWNSGSRQNRRFTYRGADGMVLRSALNRLDARSVPGTACQGVFHWMFATMIGRRRFFTARDNQKYGFAG